MDYVELHAHSAFSFLDGASLPTELAASAAEHGYEALALTDHDGLWGAMEHAQACKPLGVRPIVGVELTIDITNASHANELGTASTHLGSPRSAGRSHASPQEDTSRLEDGQNRPRPRVARGAPFRAQAPRAREGAPRDRTRGREVDPEPPLTPDGAETANNQQPGGETAHLTLLVENATGWRNLCRLITEAHSKTRPDPRRDPLPPVVSLTEVERHAEGLVCLSGCAREGALAGRWQRDEARTAEALGKRLLGAFGPDRLRVELQRPLWRRDRTRNRWLSALGERLGVPCVATGNVHFHHPRRAPLQDAFVSVRLGGTLEETEPRRRGNTASCLLSPATMANRFRDHPEAVRETARVAERLGFDLTTELGYRYPGSEDPDADRTLAELCRARLTERYRPGERDGAERRLEEELRVIRHLRLSGFFLLHRDLLELAREVAIEVRGPESARRLLPAGRGRGSSVSSIVCYLTGLSHVDPVRNGLFLGRFLNEEISEVPDIDLDFPRDIREILIPRVHERYGADRSALVAAFPTYRSRGAVRDLGKALGLPQGEIERVARAVDVYGAPDSVGDEIAAAIGRQRAESPRWQALIELAAEARGLPRHVSQHPGGMILSTRPLIDLCPVQPAAMEGRQLVQWDKDSCADAGFLKIDLLGLGMLSAVERCVDEVARVRGELIDLSRIPLDDAEVYRQIRRAETTGVFQIESRAQMQMLPRSLPRNLDDLTVQVAIVRPGPIQGGAVHPYLERRKRLRQDPGYRVPYDHPSLEPILSDTLGAIVFQDQVIQVAMVLAGFSAGEAEGLRRAMSRKRSEEALRAYRERFIEGGIARGVKRAICERVFEQIQGFSGFGFPKSHAAAFALLAYQSTWLRVHYGAEFLCALLNEQPMGFYPPDALVHEAQRRGFKVLGPDVNHSAVECQVEVLGPGQPADRGASSDRNQPFGDVEQPSGSEVSSDSNQPPDRGSCHEGTAPRGARLTPPRREDPPPTCHPRKEPERSPSNDLRRESDRNQNGDLQKESARSPSNGPSKTSGQNPSNHLSEPGRNSNSDPRKEPGESSNSDPSMEPGRSPNSDSCREPERSSNSGFDLLDSRPAPNRIQPELAVRIGLGYVSGLADGDAEAVVGERERGGEYGTVGDLASRSGASRDALERLSWAGALASVALDIGAPTAGGAWDALPSVGPTSTGGGPARQDPRPRGSSDGRPADGRQAAAQQSSVSGPADRSALWTVGVTANGARRESGVQMALPINVPSPPQLDEAGRWDRIVAGYDSIGISLEEHPMALIREDFEQPIQDSRDLAQHPDGARIEIAGMVMARQRPDTASGVVFVLLEDEWGMTNLVVPASVYDRYRLIARTAPFISVLGKFERRDGVVNVVVKEIHELTRPDLPKASVRHIEPPPDHERDRPDRANEAELAEQHAVAAAGGGAPGIAELKAALPPGHSFGRRGR